MMDELGRLSDSTSEEHSIHSYTSESFDDNGKWSLHAIPCALGFFFPLIPLMLLTTEGLEERKYSGFQI